MHLQPAREGHEKVVKEATVALVAHVKVSALYVLAMYCIHFCSPSPHAVPFTTVASQSSELDFCNSPACDCFQDAHAGRRMV